MSSANEFQEIAHCGGKVTFSLRTNGESKSYSVRISHNRPTPASWFAVYALYDGRPIGDIELGGTGQSWGPPPTTECFPVFIASDRESYFGHSCLSGCNGYWRAQAAPSKWRMTCPYCGIQRPTYAFRSPAQLRYIQHYVATLLGALADLTVDAEVVIDMDEIVESAGSQPPPNFYAAEVSRQCRFTCELCGVANDVLGHFGYCCCCGARNNFALFRTETSRVLAQLASRSAAAAVKDLVSAYESCGRNYVSSLAQRIPMTGRRTRQAGEIRFHDTTHSARAMVDLFGIDPLKDVSKDQAEFASRMFFRRHVYEHNAGVADQRYLDRSGDTSVIPGQALRETPENATRLGEVLSMMMANIDAGFRDIFPPEKGAARLNRA